MSDPSWHALHQLIDAALLDLSPCTLDDIPPSICGAGIHVQQLIIKNAPHILNYIQIPALRRESSVEVQAHLLHGLHGGMAAMLPCLILKDLIPMLPIVVPDLSSQALHHADVVATVI